LVKASGRHSDERGAAGERDEKLSRQAAAVLVGGNFIDAPVRLSINSRGGSWETE
jgi:hypothetical protein